MDEEKQIVQVAVELDYDIHRSLSKYAEFFRKTLFLRKHSDMESRGRVVGNYDTSTHRFYIGDKGEAKEFSKKLRKTGLVKSKFLSGVDQV